MARRWAREIGLAWLGTIDLGWGEIGGNRGIDTLCAHHAGELGPHVKRVYHRLTGLQRDSIGKESPLQVQENLIRRNLCCGGCGAIR